MDFRKLTDTEISEFLSLANLEELAKLSEISDRYLQAEKLFEGRKNLQPNTNSLTYPVVDLYLAANYRGPRNVQYAPSDILKLTPAQILEFARLFSMTPSGDFELDRNRILRILRILDLLFTGQKETFLSDPIIKNLCANLGVQELNQLRISLNLKKLDCPVPIQDPNGYISLPQFSEVTSLTALLASRIAAGSADALIWAIDQNEISMVQELLKLGVPADFIYVDENTFAMTPLIRAIELQREEIIQLLLKSGANPNLPPEPFELPDPNYPLASLFSQEYGVPRKIFARNFLVEPFPLDIDPDGGRAIDEKYLNLTENGPSSVEIPGYQNFPKREDFEGELYREEEDPKNLTPVQQEENAQRVIRIADQLLQAGASFEKVGLLEDDSSSFYLSKENPYNTRILQYLQEKGFDFEPAITKFHRSAGMRRLSRFFVQKNWPNPSSPE